MKIAEIFSLDHRGGDRDREDGHRRHRDRDDFGRRHRDRDDFRRGDRDDWFRRW